MGVAMMAGCSSGTWTISVAVMTGAHSAGGEGERLLGAVERVGVEVVLEVGVEVGGGGWTGAWSSAEVRGSAVAALEAADL